MLGNGEKKLRWYTTVVCDGCKKDITEDVVYDVYVNEMEKVENLGTMADSWMQNEIKRKQFCKDCLPVEFSK